MCLGIPGRVLETYESTGLHMARVDFGGIRREACLAYTPEAAVGDYVVVHVGFAITTVDETEAARTLAVLRAMSDAVAGELGEPLPAEVPAEEAEQRGCKDAVMEQTVSRQEASEAVQDHGWRYVLGALQTSVTVGTLAQAVSLAADAAAVCGDDADRHLRIDVRADRAVFTLQSSDRATVTARDIELARRISAAADKSGFLPEPGIGAGAPRTVQILEIAIDALDIAGIRPFWKAVLGYTDEAGTEGPEEPLVDPVGQGPAIWFQQMDRARPQRNRLHLDISVPHDEAARRIEAALAAGGRLVSATDAPAFWVLADLEGNEACVTTWQGRDS
ncbi:HypC/HybG/HupF family hydrogenase formation chaperone [Streptomyces sp. NPDC059788]|uniref:HypC/HybG/HupF family hydrogenase formation chaperone n=1 Tax=Streptomyces sp. NPDC059788 TaxID=3346948 RepID=UPI0036659633